MTEKEYSHRLTGEQLRKLDHDGQQEVMEQWFRAHYEDPAENTPHDSEEGYVYVWGGPYDALEELMQEFEGVVPRVEIEILAKKLDDECPEWAPVDSKDDYDPELFEAISLNVDPPTTFKEAADKIRQLLKAQVGAAIEPHLLKLLFANVITAVETVLGDLFINELLRNKIALGRFFESTPEFKEKKLTYAELLKTAENAEEIAKEHLVRTLWHDVRRVCALYSGTFNVEIGSAIGEVAKAIPKRHDIVHRNGRDTKGNEVPVTSTEVQDLLAAAERFVGEVIKRMKDRKPDDGWTVDF